MTLQNVRSLLWRGEDLGGTGSGTRELIVPTQVAAAARPQIQSVSFVGSISVDAFLGARNSVIAGLNRIIVNKSPDYWVTLLASMASGSVGPGNYAISVPIPPLGFYFVPANVFSSSTQLGVVQANSAWPIPVPLSGTGFRVIPIATALTAITIDLVTEQ